MLQSLSNSEEILLLARLHAEDLDENLINMYLQAKYQSDLFSISGCAALSHVEPAKQQTRTTIPHTCRNNCPHVYGEVISGYREVVLPGESRYVGDVVNGHFNGLGMLTLEDGTKLQGEFRNSQLVWPFLVGNLPVTRKEDTDKGDIDHELRSDAANQLEFVRKGHRYCS